MRNKFLRIADHIKNNSVAGLLACLPIFATFLILKFLFDFTDGLFKPLLGLIPWISDHTTGTSAATALALIYFVGLISRHVVGNRLMNFLLNTLPQRTPFVKSIYSIAKSFIDAVTPGNDSKITGKVVMMELSPLDPKPKMLGLLMNVVTISEKGSAKLHGVVFISSSPFPQSGQLILVPISKISDVLVSSQNDNTPEEIRMNKGEFLKQDEYMGFIASMGTQSPRIMTLKPLDVENLINKNPLD